MTLHPLVEENSIFSCEFAAGNGKILFFDPPGLTKSVDVKLEDTKGLACEWASVVQNSVVQTSLVRGQWCIVCKAQTRTVSSSSSFKNLHVGIIIYSTVFGGFLPFVTTEDFVMNFPAETFPPLSMDIRRVTCGAEVGFFTGVFWNLGSCKLDEDFIWDWACQSLSILGPNGLSSLEMAVPVAEHLGRAASWVQNGRVSFARGLEEGTASSVCNSQAPPCHPGALTLSSHL